MFVNGLTGQNLNIFELNFFEKDSTHRIALTTLTDVYHFSENADSLAIPDLSSIGNERASEFTYMKLNPIYRKRFLINTKTSDTDTVFIYDYSMDKLLSFPVKSLDAIALLNIYGAEWPYTQKDYMFGFEVNKKYLKGFDEQTHSLVYIGKNNPFVRGEMKLIHWKKIESGEFPSKQRPVYDSSYTGKCVIGSSAKYEAESLTYFIQELIRIKNNKVAAKRLIVVDIKTKKTICEKFFYSGESAYFSPSFNQWTGKLFKNKPPVIFGFHAVIFGCPSITYLSAEPDIQINCDNWH